MISERQRKIIERITVYKSGELVGRPTNERLRELNAMLNKYAYSDQELGLLEAETPARAIKTMQKEREGVR